MSTDRRYELGPDETLTMVPGIVFDGSDEASMAYVRKETHDALIRQTSHLRASGIWWTHHTGDEALHVLDDTQFGVASPEHAAYEQEMRELLASPSAVLVVAWRKVSTAPPAAPAAPPPRPPAARDAVLVCMSCQNWQIDLHPRGISDHGGGNAALMAAAQEHVQHLNDECPGGLNSRIKFNGKWVDQPVLSDGRQFGGSMAVYALPRWWVWR